MLIIIQVNAQIETDIEIATQTGYENNIFKSPDSFIDEDTGELLGKDGVQRSSFFQDIGIRGLFSKRWDNQKLSLRLNPKGRFYFSDDEASYFTIYSRLRYENELSRNTKWLVTARYNYRDRDGENLDDSELRTPLGYAHVETTSTLHFRLYKQNRTLVELKYANRDYKDGLTNNLSYNLIGIRTVFRNVFKRRAGYHSYGVEASFNKRHYKRVFFDGLEATTKRDWSYIDVEGFYRYPITENWQLRPSFQYMTRVDNDAGRFTYTQVKPTIAVSYNAESFSMDVTASYTNRNYDQLRATNTNGDDLGLLKFKYYRLRVNAEKQIAHNLFITANAYVNIRESNRTNQNSLIFRGYDHFYVGFGLKINL